MAGIGADLKLEKWPLDHHEPGRLISAIAPFFAIEDVAKSIRYYLIITGWRIGDVDEHNTPGGQSHFAEFAPVSMMRRTLKRRLPNRAAAASWATSYREPRISSRSSASLCTLDSRRGRRDPWSQESF